MFAFGDSRQKADHLAMLAREDAKTATCSTLWTYEEEQKPLPKRGDNSVILDGNDVPLCGVEERNSVLAKLLKEGIGLRPCNKDRRQAPIN